MMRFDIISIFPELFVSSFSRGVIQRGVERGLLEIQVHDLRRFAPGPHRQVDDKAFGGGGMVLQVEPIDRAVRATRQPQGRTASVLLTPQGRLLSQRLVEELAAVDQVVLVAGRYDGVDERVAERVVDYEISIGDYILSGGELPAMVLVEAVARLVPGVVGNPASLAADSFAAEEADGVVLGAPVYTRPATYRDWTVPETLLSGHHQAVSEWRRRRALEKTLRHRPDLLGRALLAGEGLSIQSDRREEAHDARDRSDHTTTVEK